MSDTIDNREEERRQLKRRIQELEVENGVLRSLLDKSAQGEKIRTINDGTDFYVSTKRFSTLAFFLCLVIYVVALIYGASIINIKGPYSPEYEWVTTIKNFSGLGTLVFGFLGVVVAFLLKKVEK